MMSCSSCMNQSTVLDRNASDHTTENEELHCAKLVPDAQSLFAAMPMAAYIAFGLLVLFTLITFAIYIEEIVYVVRTFKNDYRTKTTLKILAVYPVYSCCSLLGAAVPRAGPLVDLVASVYFAMCLFNFSGLMMNYLGGLEKALRTIKEGRPVRLNVPPCCCCCVCLPTIKFKPRVMKRIAFLVLQIVIVRPVMNFSGAILFVNGNFDYGALTPFPMYPIIALVNAISMLLAIYGLMLFRRIFRADLETRFSISGKILSIQLVMISISVPNLITTVLVHLRVIKCNEILPAPTRGDEICQAVTVMMMLPLCIIGRIFYRRSADADVTEKDGRPTCNEVHLQQLQQVQVQQLAQQHHSRENMQSLNNSYSQQPLMYLNKSSKSSINIDLSDDTRPNNDGDTYGIIASSNFNGGGLVDASSRQQSSV